MDRNYGGEGASSDLGGGGSSSSKSAQIPVPMEGLHQAGPPPFLTKTYDIVDNQSTNHIISWSSGNNSFVVWDPQAFAMTLLPRYFKHNNFSSFVRQLNTYGFRKVDPDRWEFANEEFLRGQRHLLSNIRRRRTSGSSPQTPFPLSQQSADACVEVGLFGSLDKEIDRLKRDKQMLMLEMAKIRQQQKSNKTYLASMEQRLRGTEMKQQQLMRFLAKAIRNPAFMQQLIQQRELRKNNLLVDAANKRRHIDQGPSDIGETVTKTEPFEDQYINFETPQQQLNMMLGGTDLQSAGFSEPEGDQTPHMAVGDEQERSLDELFWDQFLNDNNTGEDLSFMGGDGEDDTEENLFISDHFGDQGSS
uniref:HSF-type DNA-binding domain-containing protein n=1 Tax=Kalanchoe fedtschenkoi TaxID=63787 RepID=A0A7N0V9F3_KALFE